jgi:integrase
MVAAGMVRRSVNKTVSRIRSVFRWGAAEQLVDPSVVTALEMVAPLLAGRTEAAESEPVAAVPEADLAATLPHLAAPVRAMVEVQLWSGCRPGEVVAMCGRDIDRAGLTVAGVQVWAYTPAGHKAEHHEKERVIYLGPRAQEIIGPWLTADASAPLFPAEAPRCRSRAYKVSGYRQAVERAYVAAALAHLAAVAPDRKPALDAIRKSVTAAESALAAALRAKPRPNAEQVKPLRAAAAAAAQEFRRALAAAVAEHKAPRPWHPHRLRPNAAERLEAEHGLEAAQNVLGHSMPDTTRIYSQAHRRKAAEVMGRSG